MPRKIAAIQLSLAELANLLHLPTGVEITRVENRGVTGDLVIGRCTLVLEGDRLPDYCEAGVENEGSIVPPLAPKWKTETTKVFDRWK